MKATVEQILRLERAGCEIIRCTKYRRWGGSSHPVIKKQIHIPLVADIHFDYRMALAAIENGADKIRINPGNIRNTERVKAVVDAAKRGISRSVWSEQRFPGEAAGWKIRWSECGRYCGERTGQGT